MRRWLVFFAFLAGLALGVAGSIMAPGLAAPYLPTWIRGKTELFEGTVVRKHQEKDRLLLTVQSAQGAILATFRQRVPEIDLLVGEGDILTLALPGYQPFVDDPAIRRVRKQNTQGSAVGAEPGPFPTRVEPSKEGAPR